jgi:hypothetical protein
MDGNGLNRLNWIKFEWNWMGWDGIGLDGMGWDGSPDETATVTFFLLRLDPRLEDSIHVWSPRSDPDDGE